MEIAVLSKQGGRECNEDACGYWTSESLCCFVLSDGLGGHGGGDVASKLVVSTILRKFSGSPQMSSGALPAFLGHANDALMARQRSNRRLGDMRATAVMLVIDQVSQSALWGHVGDSRLYCFRKGIRILQTRDQSVAQGIVDMGMGDARMLRTHPHRHLLLNSLGSEEDFSPCLSAEPLMLQNNDVFLLCSDGLWEYIAEDRMEQTLLAARSMSDWLATLEVELLQLAKPGHDNYSGLAVRI